MTSKALYLRLLGYVKPHRRVFALSLAGTVVVAITEPILPALLKPLLDGSFVENDPQAIRLVPLALVAVFLVRGIASFASSVAMKWVAHRVVMELRDQMFDKLVRLPSRRFDAVSGGSLLSKLTYDVNQVMTACTQALVVLVRDSIAVAGLLGWALYLNWRLSLMVFVIAPAMAAVVRVVSRRLRRVSAGVQEAMGELNHIVEEAVQGQKVVKVFGGQDYERRRFGRINNRVRQLNMKVAVAAEASVPTVQLLAAIAFAYVIYVASLQSAADEISVGGFVSLFGAMAMMLSPIKRLTKLNEPLQRGLAGAQSIFALVDEAAERDLGSAALGRVRGEIRVEGLGFDYGGGQASAALRAIDLTVRAGETIALVGPSGSGKTTLVNLLPRLYEPTSGRVLVDGVDIATVRLRDLRRNIAYVGQEIVLFNDTVAGNIAYGMEVTEAAIVEAAERANAMDFVRELPQGLQTPVGERGSRLSGGQRQRIAIARALLRDAPILILDEATSALDTESERRIQQALETLRRGRTALIIAHRLSTIESADRIVVLQRGQIVEVGTHAELLARGGLYASLQRMQRRQEAAH